MAVGLAFSLLDGRTGRLMAARYSTGPVRLPDLRDLPRSSLGLEAFALLCVRSRLAFLQSEQCRSYVLTGTEKSSAAAALYQAYNDGQNIRWTSHIFGDHGSFQACVEKEYVEGQFRVELSSRYVPPGEVRIWLNRKDISDSIEEVSRIDRALSGTPLPLPELRLSILRSGDLQYTRDIRDSLLGQLRDIGYELPKDLPEHAGLTVAPFATPDPHGDLIPEWRAIIEDLARYGQESHAIVSIGSQATMALRAHYGPKFAEPGQAPAIIYLGVTYPVSLHIVDSLYSRFENREVAGVAYGADGLRSIAALIRNWLVPDQRLKFIYFDEHPQDREGAAQLRRTRLYSDGQLLVQRATPDSFRSAAEEDDSVLFSWYTIESILESVNPEMRELASFLESRRFVATTRMHCRRGRAFASVSGDDRSIGATGAETLHGWRIGTIPRLGHHPVAIP